MLKKRTWAAMTAQERDDLVSRKAAQFDSTELRESISALVADVRDRGDAALCEALATFDGVQVEPDGLRVSAAEVAVARDAVGPELTAAIKVMIANIRRFNEELHERRGSWQTEIAPGHIVGEQIGPIASAAAFCPSGKASYPSVMAQVATGAVVAGVPELVAIVPPVPGGAGEVDPAVLVVADELGLENVFRVNGPAGVAAAAFGTESIPRVAKVVGPGSPPVSLAQLEIRRFGVDSVVLGPSESLIIADDSVDVQLLAADLLNEAEHGPDGTILLVTAVESLVDPVGEALRVQAAGLPDERREAAEASLGVNGGAIVVDDLDEAFAVANWFAPEHLQLAISDAASSVERITDAGEILVGQTTPLSAGNFCLGAPAALPTGGYAKQSGGITVETFLKATSIGSLTPAALAAIAPSVTALADHEGFPAHANAIHLRQP